MNAVILAAGVGKRLRPFTEQHPKCLLEFGGTSLLRRHLAMLESRKMKSLTIVTGHLEEQVRAEVMREQPKIPVSFVRNAEYEHGSALSLFCAAAAFRGVPAIIMDADILFDQRVLDRLLDSPTANCLAVDNSVVDTGEEVKVVVSPAGRVLELGKQASETARVLGESVGIFKFSATAGTLLGEALGQAVAVDRDAEYEPVMNGLLGRIEMGFAEVGDLPWLEIDFPGDVERARHEIWPRIQAVESLTSR